MFRRRSGDRGPNPPRSPRVAVILLSLALVACSTAENLPDSAREALTGYWESLPSYPSVEHRIVRSWPGAAGVFQAVDSPEREVWCVEAEIVAAVDPELVGEQLVWIVIREQTEARWSAALLASLSSLWPYQACGEAPS